jgi:hypothetical protein
MGKKSVATAQIDALISKAGGKNKGGKKSRKHGWYKRSASCMRYKGEQRWVSNKLRRMERHIRRFPEDAQARNILSQLA